MDSESKEGENPLEGELSTSVDSGLKEGEKEALGAKEGEKEALGANDAKSDGEI